MRSITRREAVGTLVGLPAMSLVKSLGIAETAGIGLERPAASSITTLNVVFHGLFAFVVWKNPPYIQAIAPIVSNHFYLAGGKASSSLQALTQGQTYTLNA